MKRPLYTILTVMLLAMPSALSAQTANNDTIRRTVLVESVYNPVLASSEKRSFLPEDQQPATTPGAVVYADENYNPGNLVRSPFGSAAVALREQRLQPAYLRLGYGTRNNADLLGLYRAKLSDDDMLNLGASLTGWSGNIPYKGLTALMTDSGTWQSHRYDTDVHIGYAHEGHTRFGVNADMGYYTRNYLPSGLTAPYDTDSQHSLWYGGDAYVLTPLRNIPAELGFSGGFHRWQNSSWQGNDNPNAENHFQLNADFTYRFKRAGRLEIALTNDYLTYSHLPDTTGHYFLGFHPSWVLEGRQGLVALGVNVDVQPTETQTVRFSPNCRFVWTPTAPLRLELAVDGGRDMQTFSDLYRLSPWWTANVPLQKAYTYLNTRLHMGVRVTEGLHLGLNGGYRLTDDALFATEKVTNGLLFTGLTNHDARVWTFGADATYEWKDLVRFKADFAYYGWQGVNDQPALLAYAPQVDAGTSLRVRIVRGLHADAAFRYRQFCDTGSGRKDAVADVSLKADYALNHTFSLFLSGENLLNRQSGWCAAYPAQGIRAVGGVVIKL